MGGRIWTEDGTPWMRFKAWGQGLTLGRQLFLLLQQFLLPSNHPTDIGAQLGEFFLQLIDGLLRAGLLAFIVTAEALQQGFRLVIRMLVAATHRARLVVLQLRAQLFDTGTAGQTLAFEQFAGDVEGLFGDGQFGLGFHPVLGKALAFVLRIELTLLQFGTALVQLLLTGPQARQVLDGAQLLAAAGVLEGRECSAYPACAPEVRLAGGTYIDIPVTDGHVQGNLATAPAWPAHPNWLAGFLGLLGTKITL